ncbi:MAG TPA: aminotransferase class IV [bacterium]|nr:aminotransferase class IV [bacterium]
MSNSVFTTVRIAGFKAVWIEDHLIRLQKGAEKLGIVFDENLWLNAVISELANNTLNNARMRMILDGTVIPKISFEPFSDPEKKMHVRLRDVEPQGDLKRWPFVKHTEKTDEEVILIDRNTGSVLEGSYNNVFVRTDDGFFTPPGDGKIVSGICRKHFIRYLKLKGIVVREEYFDAGFLKKGDIFLTNALRGVIRGGFDV